MSTRRCIDTVIVSTALTLQIACGGGGGGSSSPLNDGGVDAGVLATNNGCEQEYFQTMLGTYTGLVEVTRTISEVQQICHWDLSFDLRGSSAVNDCRLQVSTQGEVTQQTFYPEDYFDRYQCLDDTGTRAVHEPIANTFPPNVNPGLDNSNYPVEVDVFSATELSSGPYFGDESVTTRYLRLFDGVNTKLVRTVVVEGDGTISLRSGDGSLMGTLVKK